MNIRHERPMPDFSFRVSAPLHIEFENGKKVSAVEWSLSGVVLPAAFWKRKNLPTKGRLSIPFQGVDIRFDVEFAAGEEKDTLNFVGLTGRQRETLALFYRSILSGNMASTNDVITSLDTPVDLVPMGETEEEFAEGTRRAPSRLLRAILVIAIYLALAVFVFGVVGTNIWARLNTIHLEHSRSLAPEIQVVAPVAAFVDRVLVHPGDQVKRGDTLAVLSDPKRSGAIEDTRYEIKLAERRIRQTRDQLRNHEAKKDVFRAEYLAAYLDAVARRRLEDFLGGYNLQKVTLAWLELQAFDLYSSFRPGDFADIRNQIRSVLAEKKQDLKRLKRVLSTEKAAASALNIISTSDGVVQQLLIFENQFTRRGEIAALVEENKPRHAVGWLDDRLADKVFVGMKARITVFRRTGKTSITGTVTNIEAGNDPTRPDKFGMIVTVEADGLGVDGSRQVFQPNAPVRIDLSRNLLGRNQSVAEPPR